MSLGKLCIGLSMCLVMAVVPVLAEDGSPLPRIEPHQLRHMGDHESRDFLGASIDVGLGGKVGTSSLSSNVGLLPLLSYSVKAAQNGRTYTGSIVAANAGNTATVPVVLVPVVIKITQGGHTYTFDPTVADAGCLGTNTAFGLTQGSPLFNNASYTFSGASVGPTQYGDAFLTGEFGSSIGHLALSPSVGSALTISVNAGLSGSSTATVYSVGGLQCNSLLGVVNINTIDAALQSYISAHTLTSAQFPFFVTYNAVMSQGSANRLNNCCILGYHNALGSPGQTYGIAEFEGRNQTVFSGVSDVSAASHEINEWINDPAGTNATPYWGNIGQVSGCQANFEVGDPLSGSLMPVVSMGGFNYHLQELAYFSWFYGGPAGLGGAYSNNGTFKGSAKLCPPGGTN